MQFNNNNNRHAAWNEKAKANYAWKVLQCLSTVGNNDDFSDPVFAEVSSAICDAGRMGMVC